MDVIPVDELKSFIQRCMEQVGTKATHAEVLANVLVDADKRGHYSQGLNRLLMYIVDVKSGTTTKSGIPIVLKETLATAWVDGANLLGPVVGHYCMDLAITKAKRAGVGWVCAKASNHYGMASHYSMMALKHGMLGMSFTNSLPTVVPTRSRSRLLGSNPLTIAAPATNGDSFVLDMTTSSVDIAKVEKSHMNREPIPLGWGVNEFGEPTTEPDEVLTGGGLSPLGGDETTGGHKGYGLASAVEVFCGILSGSDFGPAIGNLEEKKTAANLGQCFVAINPNVFAGGFEDRMSNLMGQCRDSMPAIGEAKVLFAGDKERDHEKLVVEKGGIPYEVKQIDDMYQVAKNLGVTPAKVIRPVN